MPSIVGREDLRAKLYSSGVRNPRELSGMMRLIEVYALQVARKTQEHDLEDVPDPVAPSFTPLKPGEWSVALEVTCCVGCTRVRRWDDYHVDKHHPTGHKVLCRDCRNPGRKLPESASDVRRGGWLCPKCDKRKVPLDFPLEKRMNPRKPLKCLSCLDKTLNDSE